MDMQTLLMLDEQSYASFKTGAIAVLMVAIPSMLLIFIAYVRGRMDSLKDLLEHIKSEQAKLSVLDRDKVAWDSLETIKRYAEGGKEDDCDDTRV